MFVYFILNVRAAIESLFERLILLLLEDSNKQSAENFDERLILLLLENSNKQMAENVLINKLAIIILD